jgi:hypothetical protein
MRPQRRQARHEQAVRARFREVTGLALASVRVMPPELLDRRMPSPVDILAQLAVPPRTANLLRRHGAHQRSEGDWTCGRLLTIRGFGVTALLDVLSAPRLQDAPRPRAAAPDRALAVIARSLPASERDIERRLAAEGLLRGRLDLSELERAARFRDQEPPFAVLRREGMTVAVPSDRLPLATLALSLATRAVVNWGLAPVRYIAFQAHCPDVDFVAAVLAAKETFRWIHRPLGWFWFENPRARLVQAIEKVLSVGRPVRLADLARTLFRRWPPEVIPPLLVLRELCRRLPQLVIAGNTVRLAAARPAEELTPADHEILALFRNWGPRIDGFRLPFISQKLGLGAEALRRFLRSSFWVIERQPGVFQLIGT